MATRSFIPFREHLERGGAGNLLRDRITKLGGPDNPSGEFVLYWAQSARRIRSNLALDYAIHEANEAGLPVVVYESLRPDYREASDRIHSFILEGVAANARDAASRGVRYHFFLPRTRDDARGVLRALSRRARLTVTDDYPTFVVREQTASFAPRSSCPVTLVDNNGILPMRTFEKEQYSARFFRDRAFRMFEERWGDPPEIEPDVDPFEGEIDLPRYDGELPRDAAASCDINHGIVPVPDIGGRDEALRKLDRFVEERLSGYTSRRNREADRTSELSAYLHFGFISAHEIAKRVLLSNAPDEDVDAYLEQLIIRRELSFNMCFFNESHESLDCLPDWARKTLEEHAGDRRSPTYTEDVLEKAETDDEVWNLAQRGLLESGTIHNYLRMLWGKNLIEWFEDPKDAHAFMVRMHDRYAIDGRDPNTHAGILWCFGKHDRPWFERPIFGKIRYMSSNSTRKKVDLDAYRRKVAASALGVRPSAEDKIYRWPTR